MRSSGPAVLSFLKEKKASLINLGLIHVGVVMSWGLRSGLGPGWVVLPGKCSFNKVIAEALESCDMLPSGCLMYAVVLLLVLLCIILDSFDAVFCVLVFVINSFQLSLFAFLVSLQSCLLAALYVAQLDGVLFYRLCGVLDEPAFWQFPVQESTS